MAFAKVMIQTPIELILRVRLGGGPNVVVGCAGQVGLRIVRQDRDCDWIEAGRGNGIAREGRSGRGCRIVDWVGKYSLPLRSSWYGAESRDARPQPRALPIHKVERAVLLHRAAERESVLIPAELGLC